MTLTFELGTRVLHMTHRLHMVNISAKLFQNLRINDDITVRTSYIMSIFDLWARVTGLAHDKPTPHEEHFCQVNTKSSNEWWIYSPDKLYYSHIKPLTSKCDLELWARDMGLARDILHVVNICDSSKSLNKWWIHSLDKIRRMDAQTYTKPPLWQLMIIFLYNLYIFVLI